MRFPESLLAHELLDGMRGIEIGGAAHNAFGLDTWNVDMASHLDPVSESYRTEQTRMCGEVMEVDVVSRGDRLPFADKSLDFVISSHVIEHFFDPIAALEEWSRVATSYVFLICPHRDALGSDRAKSLTTLDELIDRHEGRVPVEHHANHHSRWTLDSFVAMCSVAGHRVVATEDPDTKVGNGFTVVIDVRRPDATDERRHWRRVIRQVLRRPGGSSAAGG